MSERDPRYGDEVHRRMAGFPGAGSFAAGPDVVSGHAGDREQGAEVVLQCRLQAGRIAEARFRAFGCPHLLAAASWVCESLRGADRARLECWDWREAADALEVPPAKFGRLLTLQDAVREIARNWPGSTGSTV